MENSSPKNFQRLFWSISFLIDNVVGN
jgi:tetratricopeptide (TPR) repeat protein